MKKRKKRAISTQKKCIHGLMIGTCGVCLRMKQKKPTSSVPLDEIIKILVQFTNLPKRFARNIFTLPEYTFQKALNKSKKKFNHMIEEGLDIQQLSRTIETWKKLPTKKRTIENFRKRIEKIEEDLICYKSVSDQFEILAQLTNLPVKFVKNIFSLKDYTFLMAIKSCLKEHGTKPLEELDIQQLSRTIETWKKLPTKKRTIEKFRAIVKKIENDINQYRSISIIQNDLGKHQNIQDYIQNEIASQYFKKGSKGLSVHRKDIERFIKRKWHEIASSERKFGLSIDEKYQINVEVPLLNRLGINKIEFRRKSELTQPAIGVNFIMKFGFIGQYIIDMNGQLYTHQEINKIFPKDYKRLLNLAAVIYYADLVIPQKPQNKSSRKIGTSSKMKSKSNDQEIQVGRIKKIPRSTQNKSLDTKNNKRTDKKTKRIAKIDPFRMRLPTGKKPSFDKIIEADQHGISLQGPGYPDTQYTFVKAHIRGEGDKIPEYYYTDYRAIKTFESLINILGFE